jgi:hypothetical protein
MKELSETIFCFWRKFFGLINIMESPIRSAKIISENKERQPLFSKLISLNLDEKNVFKFEEAEIPTDLTIEEVIFPLKNLNLTEENLSFIFDFTKDKIISSIEKEIYEFPMIKMYYTIPNSSFINRY